MEEAKEIKVRKEERREKEENRHEKKVVENRNDRDTQRIIKEEIKQ